MCAAAAVAALAGRTTSEERHEYWAIDFIQPARRAFSFPA
jgi:hypothetical protein